MEKIKIRIPATSANLGPGFDVIALAVEVYNEFEIIPGWNTKVKIEVSGEGADFLGYPNANLVYKTIVKIFDKYNHDLPNLKISQINNIPPARGMGSSATAVLAGALTAQKLIGKDLPIDELIKVAVSLEGHCDNLMAAYMGGIVINYIEEGKYRGIKFMPPEPLSVVLAVPDIKIKTSDARGILPSLFPTCDVVENLRGSSILVYALTTGNYSLLKQTINEKMHQQYRAGLITGYDHAIEAAMTKGAYCAGLSGSGSTTFALCSPDKAEKVGSSMCGEYEKKEIPCRYIITKVSQNGASIE